MRNIRSVHSKLKPYECDVCKNQFATPSNIRDHWKSVHSEERPYRCNQCNKAFKLKGNLTKHISSMHEKCRPFQCVLCGDYFSRVGYKYHISDFHKELNCFVQLQRLTIK